MQIPLRITFQGVEHSEAVEQRIRDKAAKLERFHGDITGCHVVVDVPHKHSHKGHVYEVRIDITVPGGEIVINREPGKNQAHEDVYVAIRDSFDAAVRRIEDHIRKRRGEVKVHEPPPHGRVVRMFADDGYGFLETPDGLEVYFHENAVSNGDFHRLDPGSEVRFVLAEGEGEKGPQASTVTPVGKHHPVG